VDILVSHDGNAWSLDAQSDRGASFLDSLREEDIRACEPEELHILCRKAMLAGLSVTSE
jgi:hypothetical protein